MLESRFTSLLTFAKGLAQKTPSSVRFDSVQFGSHNDNPTKKRERDKILAWLVVICNVRQLPRSATATTTGYACRKPGLAPLTLVVGFRSRPAHIQGDSPMRALRATNPHRSSSYSWRKLGCVEVALIWRGFHTSRVWNRLRLESRFTSLLASKIQLLRSRRLIQNPSGDGNPALRPCSLIR